MQTDAKNKEKGVNIRVRFGGDIAIDKIVDAVLTVDRVITKRNLFFVRAKRKMTDRCNNLETLYIYIYTATTIQQEH